MATHSSSGEPAHIPADEGQAREKQTPDHKMDPLAGNWTMALPAGFRYEMNVRRLAPGRYVLEKAVRFSGVYERRRNRLVMVKPANRDDGGFEWEIAEDCLILVKQRPLEKLGSDYRGATLKRPDRVGNNVGQPAAATKNRNPARLGTGLDAKSPSELEKLTVDTLVPFLKKGSPVQLYGRRFEFTGTILRIGKGVDGSKVPFVRIEGWSKGGPYRRAYVHNVVPDFVGKIGDRVKISSLIVEHGYGTLFLWCYHWERQDP